MNDSSARLLDSHIFVLSTRYMLGVSLGRRRFWLVTVNLCVTGFTCCSDHVQNARYVLALAPIIEGIGTCQSTSEVSVWLCCLGHMQSISYVLGDTVAPSTSEWLTKLLPTKVWLILETWGYINISWYWKWWGNIYGIIVVMKHIWILISHISLCD